MNPVKSIKRTANVPFSATQMYELVNDVARYPEFLPWCSRAEILQQDVDELKARLDIGYGGLQKSFTTHNRMQTNKMIEIRLLDGSFKHLEGFWLFDALSDTSSEIRFSLEFEFVASIFNFAFEPVFHQMADSMVDAFSERATNIYTR
jgi:ribosome-associated toxin RatA of RatAB toxin-antitoxin module